MSTTTSNDAGTSDRVDVLKQARAHLDTAEGAARGLATLTRTQPDPDAARDTIAGLTAALGGIADCLGKLAPGVQVARLTADHGDVSRQLHHAALKIGNALAHLHGDPSAEEVSACSTILVASATDVLQIVVPVMFLAGQLEGLSAEGTG